MRKIISSITIVLLIFLVASFSKVSAKVLSNDKGTVTVADNEIVNDDLFVKAQTFELDGVVNGDVFVGAQIVRIPGTVNGNLHVGAQTVSLDGTVKGNIYLGGQNVTLTGANVGGSLLVGCQSLYLDNKTIIGGSLLAGAADINIDSQVKRSVYLGTGMLTVEKDTLIGKDLYYASGQNQGGVNISPDAKIGGTIHKSEVKTGQAEVRVAKNDFLKFLHTARLFTSIISFVSAIIVGFIYLKLFEKHFSNTSDLITVSFWKSLGIGFLATITFIPALIILLLTVVGIPIAGLAILILFLLIYFSKIVVGLSLGNWLAKRFDWKMTTFATFVLGLLVYYLLRQIPYVGGLVGMVVLWTGLGALILSTFFNKVK